MISTLPMYDRPETRGALEALWSLVRDGLTARRIPAPESLDFDAHFMEAWGRDDLVLSQICNLPLRANYMDRVTMIGTADYDVEGVPAGHYRSIWLVRQDDPAKRVEDCDGYRFALNDPLSHSGWGAPLADAASRGLQLTPHLQTGAHLLSAAAVLDGKADLACLDAVTWKLAKRWEPSVAGLREIGATGSSPGMTFVTAKGRDPKPYFEAIRDAIARLAPAHRETLSLRGIVRLDASDYDLPMPRHPWPEPAKT